jgi:elongation factor G
MKDLVAEYRAKLVEAVAETDEALMEKYFAEEDLSEADLMAGLRKGTISGQIVPMLCGSAFKNKGVQMLLDAVVDYLPSPIDIPAIKGVLPDGSEVSRKASDDEPFSALAFKLMSDKYGDLTFIRVYSGVLTKGTKIHQHQPVTCQKFLIKSI